jgi:DNA/RNA endonuclease YhcR with UshA esterase domain
MTPFRLTMMSLALTVMAQPSLAEPLMPAEAAKHIGERATVCGVVAGAKYAAQTGGRPTFIDFEKPYPNATFTALIMGSDRPKFGTPEKAVEGKQVCVTGEIRLFRGTPEIILTDPTQLTEK